MSWAIKGDLFFLSLSLSFLTRFFSLSLLFFSGISLMQKWPLGFIAHVSTIGRYMSLRHLLPKIYAMQMLYLKETQQNSNIYSVNLKKSKLKLLT